MPDFKDIQSLLKHIQNQSNAVLKNEVAEAAKQQMHEVIEEVTYEQYTPTQYVRTHELSDIANMDIQYVNDHTIEIVNTRHDGSTDVAHVVSTGLGYSWVNSAIAKAQLARDFYEDTYNFLVQNNRHVEAYKRGMRKRGIELK